MNNPKDIHQELGKLVDALLSYNPPQPRAMAKLTEDEQYPEREVTENQAEALQAEGLYIISVAARLLDMHPQTLRKYERLGFISPCRTTGMLRLYTERDIVRIRAIRHLQEDLGLNLAGIEVALTLLRRLMYLQRHLDEEGNVEQLRTLVEQEIYSLFGSLGFQQSEPNTSKEATS
jgi:MerR family transcriptional regulator/heat shock protein HspR